MVSKHAFRVVNLNCCLALRLIEARYMDNGQRATGRSVGCSIAQRPKILSSIAHDGLQHQPQLRPRHLALHRTRQQASERRHE